MKKLFAFAIVFCLTSFTLASAVTDSQTNGENTVTIEMKTNQGTIVIELDREKAPETVKNFLGYVDRGFYDGTIFHRVIRGFMIQGGGFDTEMKQKPTDASIQNEATNGLKNLTGSIAMARTPDPNSATSQFFINVADNASLDHTEPTMQGWGYCVFGRVIKGMEVVHAIENSKTVTKNGYGDVPEEEVVIEKVIVVGSS